MICQGFALFDFDNTVIRGDSILPMIRYAVKAGFVKKRHLPGAIGAFLGYALKLMDDTRAKEKALGFLRGKTKAQVDAFSQAFVQDVLIKRVFPKAREEMARCRQEGLRVLLVSASPDFYLQPLLQVLPVDGIIATRMDVSPEGIYSGHIAGRNCRNLEKPLRIAEYLAAAGYELDTESSRAYGDSGHDWPMMALTKHPVAVNGSRRLHRVCGNCRRERWGL